MAQQKDKTVPYTKEDIQQALKDDRSDKVTSHYAAEKNSGISRTTLIQQKKGVQQPH